MAHAADAGQWPAAAQAGRAVRRSDARAAAGPRRALIYLDSSVALAQLLAEDRTPPETLWQESLVASRLLEYEVWNRVNARGLGRSHGEEAML